MQIMMELSLVCEALALGRCLGNNLKKNVEAIVRYEV